MQAMMVESLALPPLLKHFPAMSFRLHAALTTPLPLLPTGPSTPATSVPWPLSSLTLFVPVKALSPWPPSLGFTHMLAARSSCV